MKNLKQIFDAAQELAGTDKIISGSTWTKTAYILNTESNREVFIRTIKIGVAYNLDYFPSNVEWVATGISTFGHTLLKIN